LNPKQSMNGAAMKDGNWTMPLRKLKTRLNLSA
jgi:hypothetical protein